MHSSEQPPSDEIESLDIRFLGGTPLLRLKKLMQILRSEDGCPWDREQNFETIAPYTIEEAYEVKEAIDQRDMDALREELGDLLFQVIFHAQMADESGAFDLDQVCDDLTRKMVRRHPHVFGQGDHRTPEQQTMAWEAQKAEERKAKSANNSLLDDVALALPALSRAEKLQKRAARIGFDWPNLDGVLDKIKEEADELAQAWQSGIEKDIAEEVGDLLFAVTNLSRKLKVDPEQALRQTNLKFTRRFQYMEDCAQSEHKPLQDMSLEALEALWQQAKDKV